MKKYLTFTKPDTGFALQFLITWIYINAALNILGLWAIKFISGSDYQALQNVFVEFVKPMLIQAVIFAVCLFAGLSLLKNRTLALMLFVILQFVAFNLIFLFNLTTSGGIHFETTWSSLGLQYLSFNGQYMVDIIQTLYPLSGEFEGEIFKPSETLRFYFYWVILTNIYYLLLTYVSSAAYRFLKR